MSVAFIAQERDSEAEQTGTWRHSRASSIAHARIPENFLNQFRDPPEMGLGNGFGPIHIPSGDGFEELLVATDAVRHDARDGDDLG